MKKHVILTFDYEVFLGSQTGTIRKSVIDPTNRVLSILRKHNAKGIFFVDATWLLFLRDNIPSEFKLVRNQIVDIVKAGSSVELHLHPQWLQASLIDGRIEFTSFENYALHTLGQSDIISLFRNSIELLESITSQKITCFRAGGFRIEPFSQIKAAFEQCGILYDFSVAPGLALKGGNVYDYDFTEAPNLPFYYFEDDVQKPDDDGRFIEIPLSTFLTNPLYRLTNKLHLKIKKDEIFGDGIGIQEKKYFFYTSLPRRLQISRTFLSLDKTSPGFFKFLLKTHFRKSNFLVMLSHPKTLSEYALLNLHYTVSTFNTLNSTNLMSSLRK
jgi:hypothetical protein